MNKTYNKKSWVSDKLEMRDSTIHGKGVYAKEYIPKGEVVVIDENFGVRITEVLNTAARAYSS